MKQKWKNLRDQFRKEIQKIPERRSGDEASIEDVKWPYFQSMLFLKDIVQPRPTKSNLDETQTSEVSQTNDSDNNNLDSLVGSNENVNISANHEPNIVEDSNNVKNDKESNDACFKRPSSSEVIVCDEESLQHKKLKTKKRPKKEDEERYKMSEFEKHMITLESKKLQMFQGAEDEDLNFLKSLLPYLKKMPDLSKMNVRTQIQNIVFQEYKNVLQMNERYLAANHENNITPIRTNSSSNSSDMSMTPSPAVSPSGRSSSIQRYYESYREETTDDDYNLTDLH